MYRRIGTAALLAGVLAVTAGGCGPRQVAVKGTVNLDGSPVEGATVDFIADDGKSYSGFTDASGGFSLTGSDQKSGVPSGTYKVTVIKQPKLGADSGGEPGQQDLSKAMAKMGKEGMKEKNKGFAGANPMLGIRPKGRATGVKTELPAVYANRETTPLSIKVPPDGPVVLELKSKQQ